MEKIKNILKPGHHKDDDTTHVDNAGTSTTSTTGTHTGHGSGVQTDSTGSHDHEKKEHGILRQILNPAGDKYDQQAFGTGTDSAATAGAGHETSTTAGQSGRKQSVVDLDNVDHLRTDPEAKKHEHGVLRQILNPHGKKYDDQAFGATAVETADNGLPEHSGKGPGELYTKPEAEKEHGVLRQIFNPGGEKYDDTRFGTTAEANAPLGVATTGTPAAAPIAELPAKIESTDAAKDNSGVLRQLVNPGGDRHDALRYGETGTAAPGSEQATSTGGSHLGRDAALGGAAATGVGAAGYAAERQHQDADRSFPLSGGSTTTATGSDAYPSANASGETGTGVVGSSYTARSYPVGDTTATTSTTSHLHPGDELASSGMTAPLPGSSAVGGTSHLGPGAAVGTGTGAGVAGGAGLAAYEKSLEPKQDVSAATYTYSSRHVGGAPGGHHDDEAPVEGYVHHVPGPHATDMANLLDPHVPGSGSGASA